MALGSLARGIQGYKIGLVCALSGSHVMMFGHLAEKLVKKGHDVTLVLPSNLKIPPDVVALKINTLRFNLTESMAASTMPVNPTLWTQLKSSTIHITPSMMAIGYSLLQDTETMNKLATENLDFMIIDPMVVTFMLIPYKLGVPFALYDTDCFDHVRRIPVLPSYIPHVVMPYSERMSFFQRVGNTVVNAISTLILATVTDMSTEYIPELPAVGIVDMLQNASLCILLRDSAVDLTRPVMPDVVQVGTLSSRPAKPLTGELLKFMDSSSHGVVLISFGSTIDELATPVLTKVFAALKQINQRVLFKCKHKLDKVPENVHVVDWMPQNDLLGHPNMKLFITHCGMNSYLEAVYQGVPLLATPFSIDQHGTAALVKSQGFGEIIDLNDFTSEELRDTIHMMIKDPGYKNKAMKKSAIMRDLQASGFRDPVFWIEHVIKYGASHLRSHAYDMPFYQYYMADVKAFLVACGLLVATMVFLFCRCVTGCLSRLMKGKNKMD